MSGVRIPSPAPHFGVRNAKGGLAASWIHPALVGLRSTYDHQKSPSGSEGYRRSVGRIGKSDSATGFHGSAPLVAMETEHPVDSLQAPPLVGVDEVPIQRYAEADSHGHVCRVEALQGRFKNGGQALLCVEAAATGHPPRRAARSSSTMARHAASCFSTKRSSSPKKRSTRRSLTARASRRSSSMSGSSNGSRWGSPMRHT